METNIENIQSIHRSYLFRCEDEIAFVFPAFIVRYDDALSFPHSFNGCQD